MRAGRMLFLLLLVALLAAGCTQNTIDVLLQQHQEGWPDGGSRGAVPDIFSAQIDRPVTSYASIGVVGDIMMMQNQIRGAWVEAEQRYDFTPSFAAMQPWFQQADFLLANLETPIAGEEAGYSIAASSKKEPDDSIGGGAATGSNDEAQTFNAPDELATSLAAVGFHALSTANNHCADRGVEGLFRTAQVVRDAGIMQVGTYLSKEDHDTPRVATVNGIRIGLVAWTFGVNGYGSAFTGEQREFAVVRTSQKQRMQNQIALCREAGAEFILAFVHWDVEHASEPESATRRLAAWMLEQGVDAIIGAHPHVVQPVEYITVQRDGADYTGLVAYSLGNFISNMAQPNTNYGMYILLTVEKAEDGVVWLQQASILPTLCHKQSKEGRTRYEVLPALENKEGMAGTISGQVAGSLEKAREYVLQIVGGAISPLG